MGDSFYNRKTNRLKAEKLRKYVNFAINEVGGNIGKRAAQDALWDVASHARCRDDELVIKNMYNDFADKLR